MLNLHVVDVPNLTIIIILLNLLLLKIHHQIIQQENHIKHSLFYQLNHANYKI